MKSTNKKRIMLLCLIICAVVLMVGNISVGFAYQYHYAPGPIERPEEPIRWVPNIPEYPEIEEEPDVPENKPEEAQRPTVTEFSFVQLGDYRVPLAGLINMTEGDCFD